MIEKNELNQSAMGGTELMQNELYTRLGSEFLSDFQIIASRVRDIDTSRIPILWLHDLAEDPEVRHLTTEESRSRFAKLVFVSNWQFTTYNKVLGVPYDCSTILPNAINPIPIHEKDMSGPVRLIYHTTPHRGLELLLPVYKELSKEYGDNLHLDVYSSFKIYGWEQRDVVYQALFDECKAHPHISYHGTVSNSEIHEALMKAHIFAYPCIWPETSCIAAIEALSAKCYVVCPTYAALPETTANFALTYDFTSHIQTFMKRFYFTLKQTIESYKTSAMLQSLNVQKAYIDNFYNWDLRAMQWKNMLENMKETKK